MSQATLAFKVRKNRRPATKKESTKESHDETQTITRKYPRRTRKVVPSVTFTAVPLSEDNPVLKEIKPVLKEIKPVLKENVTCIQDKSPGKRLCIEPPASPRSLSPSKRKCPELRSPCKSSARVPLSCITPTKTPTKTPDKFSQLKFGSPRKSSLFSPSKQTSRKVAFSKSPSSNHLSENFISRNTTFKSPIKSPVKIIKSTLKSPYKSPYKQPKVMLNPGLVSSLDLGPPVMCRKKLLQQKLGAGRMSSSPAQKSAKRQLQSCNTPDRLIGRESEARELEEFIHNNVTNATPGSIYVSGAPGTGKSASLSHILSKLKVELSFTLVEINCMSHNSNKALYSDIAAQLNCTKLTKTACQSSIVHKSKKRMIVMVLDEVDQLETADNSILYTLFEWPALNCSRLILVGIANALDLTDRQLPRLKAKVSCQPRLLHFAPYSKDQIVDIIQHRLKQVPDVDSVMDPGAIQFCARKISVITGDIRKALDICRRAIELVEMKGQQGQKVTIPFISKVIKEVYGGQLQNQLSGSTSESTLPLQQQLLLCSVAIVTSKKNRAKSETVTFGNLHKTLTKVCMDRMLQCPDFSEFVDMLSLLEARGLVSLKSHKEKRLHKASLRIQPKELEQVLEDKTLLSSIMDNAAKFC